MKGILNATILLATGVVASMQELDPDFDIDDVPLQHFESAASGIYKNNYLDSKNVQMNGNKDGTKLRPEDWDFKQSTPLQDLGDGQWSPTESKRNSESKKRKGSGIRKTSARRGREKNRGRAALNGVALDSYNVDKLQSQLKEGSGDNDSTLQGFATPSKRRKQRSKAAKSESSSNKSDRTQYDAEYAA